MTRHECPRLMIILTLLGFTVACTGPAPETGPARSGSGAGSATGAPKRLTTAILGDLNTFSYLINLGIGSIRGVDEVEKLVHSGLTIVEGQTGNLMPILAEAVPSVENGLWT